MYNPKYELLKKEIKRNIQEGVWKEGDKLPSQKKLEEMFGVSLITVKKAVSDLLSEDYLEHQPGKRNVFIKKRISSNGSNTIAVAIDCVSDRFGGTILKGIEDYLWKEKYHTIICNADRDFNKVEEYFNSFDYGKIDGIIFAPVIDTEYEKKNGEILRMLTNKGIPFVLVDRYLQNVQTSFVISDDIETARLMTDSLIKAGHTRILIGEGLDCSSMNDRIKGIKQAFHENGLAFDNSLLIQVNDNLLKPDMNPAEMKHMKSLIGQAGEFSAYYAQNNRILNAGIQSMIDMGIEIDSLQLALHSEVSNPVPPYTDNIPHVVPPIYKMGLNAARNLLSNIQEGDDTVSKIILKNEIIYGDLIP